MNTRYKYRPIIERDDYCWPDGKRLAVYIALNVESYTLGEGIIEALLPPPPPPDIVNYAWCDYGNRVGVWRILDLLNELRLPVTLLVNSHLYAVAPQIMSAFRTRGDEIACHGRTNSERQCGLSIDDETALIDEATKTVIEHEGHHPGGWLSPWISETYATPDLLKAAGYRYLLDWCCDDQPLWLDTVSGPMLSVPYPQEINDSSSMIGRFVSASDFAEMVVDQFDEMMLQSQAQPLVMGIALHSHISGQPFRLRQLRGALKHISQATRGHWMTRAGGIAEHVAQASPAAGA